MSLGSITTQYLTDIANAIRAKLGVATTYKPSQMAAAIASIPSSTPTLQTKTATYTPSGSTQTDTITPDAGYDGLDEVDVTINAAPSATIAASSGMIYGTPTITIDANGLIRSEYNNYLNPTTIYPITGDGWATTAATSQVTADVTDTYQMSTQAATTWRPSTSDQTIASGKYLTGAQTIRGVVLTNLSAGNIKQGVTVEVGDSSDLDLVASVTGTYAPTLTTKSITANGTYNASADSADGYSSVTVNVSGGASNVITGTFTTSSTTGAAASLTLPYTGSGYPIAAVFFVDGGAYNSESGNTWYNLIQRYAIGMWSMSKAATTTTPTYTSSGAQNQGVVQWIYKNSTSSYSTYNRSSVMNANSYSSSNATAQAQTVIRFKSATSLSYFVASTSYGLVANTKYRYVIAYSS